MGSNPNCRLVLSFQPITKLELRTKLILYKIEHSRKKNVSDKLHLQLAFEEWLPL